MNRKKRRIKIKKTALKKGGILLLIACVGLTLFHQIYQWNHPTKYIYSEENTLHVDVPYLLDGEIAKKSIEIPRGTQVKIKEENNGSSSFMYQDTLVELDNTYLKDSLEECINFDAVYPRRLMNLREKKGGALSDVIVKKGEKVKVTNVDVDDLNTSTGSISWYKVKKDGKDYWIDGEFVETKKDLATKNWNTGITYSTYWDEYYGNGYSKDAYIDQVDYKPIDHIQFDDNPLPENCNAVHVSLENLKKYKEYYLDFSKDTGINAFVVEVKGDNGIVNYDSKVVSSYLDAPEDSLQHSVCTLDELKELVQEFKDAGYYMIGRIVTFKDAIFAEQNIKESITDKEGNLILHNAEYWPSAYSRKAWMYNVDIAKETASCGFNEIQFDYVRFPDGLADKENSLDLKNEYGESKTAALQGFLQYARKELQPYKVYTSSDVFAWPLVAQDDQNIGQFFLAMANCVDVISPMPYADHFSMGAMGIEDPASDPGGTLKAYTALAAREMKLIPNPPNYRSWIQAYGGLSDDEIKAQIQAINEGGYDGYMVWYGFGDPSDLDTNKSGYIE